MNSPSPSPSFSPSSVLHYKSFVTTDIIIGAASFLLLILLFLLFFLLRKRNPNPITSSCSDDHALETPSSISYPLTHLDAATDGFHPSLIIGQGPLGTVYTATSASGNLFAVKRIHSHLILTNPGRLDNFSSKLKSLSSITIHPHVLPILGYSEAPGERVIVTQLSTSLELYLHASSWRSRMQIAAGAARGIEHLHGSGIVHGRVKTSNILVDVINLNPDPKAMIHRYVARVCDYGLSFLQAKEGGGYSTYDGALGFEGFCMDDVLGFGVVLLEMLSGRRRRGVRSSDHDHDHDHDEAVLGLIRMGRVEEVLDERVGSPATEGERRALVRMAKVALACVGNGRRSRPEMRQVAAILTSLEMEMEMEAY